MTKTMIAIPCFDTIQTTFFESMLGLARPQSMVVTARNSLVYDARNMLAEMAMKEGMDRILWMDSDMAFESDLLVRLSNDLDEGRRFVSALCFSRKHPIKPCIYSETGYREIPEEGRRETYSVCIDDYPNDDIFQVKGVGLAACLMEVSVIKEVYERFGSPFFPQAGFGEDLSFCRRCDELGIEMWCDSRIKVGHVGQCIFGETQYMMWRGGYGLRL